MKKLLNVLAILLALNFLVIAGGVGWLYQGGHLDKAKVLAVRAVLFPPPATQQPAAAKAADPTTQPSVRLDELLSKTLGRPASEQVEFIQHTFDVQMAQLDRRQLELGDLQHQVELAQGQLSKDRAALEAEKAKLEAREQLASKEETDKGFQDSLQLYSTMPAKQVKQIFMSMDDATVVQYLEAMPARTAARIAKEFKTAEETDRIEKIMQKMRQDRSGTPIAGN